MACPITQGGHKLHDTRKYTTFHSQRRSTKHHVQDTKDFQQ